MALTAYNIQSLIHAVGWLSAHKQFYELCVRQNIGINTDEKYSQSVVTSIEIIEHYCSSAKLDVLAHIAKRARAAAEAKNTYASIPLGSQILTRHIVSLHELLEAVYQNAALQDVWVIARSEMSKHPFGEEVEARFPEVLYDIQEAQICLKMGRSTACVFHLMRVVEFSVQQLGRKLRISIDVRDATWYQIIVQISKKVDQLPSKTPSQRERRERYGAAAAHLNLIRMATRNNVMHPKKSYSLKDATEIFGRTKALMQDLTTLLA